MPYCENCGRELSDQAVVCSDCGHPRPGARGAAFGAIADQGRTEGTAVTALVLGILGIPFCWLLLGIPAIIVGNVAKRKIKADPSLKGEGMARAGVILGWVSVALGALVILSAIANIILQMEKGTLGTP